MKYIKNFEALDFDKLFTGKYWKVRTNTPYFEISLEKIGIPEKMRLNLLEDYKHVKNLYIHVIQIRDSKTYTYIGLNYSHDFPNGSWSWRDEPYATKYMGEIIVTQEDIELNKYNL